MAGARRDELHESLRCRKKSGTRELVPPRCPSEIEKNHALPHPSQVKSHYWLSLVLSAAWIGAGCHPTELKSAPAAPVATAEPAGKPQPRLATIKLWLGSQEVVAEQAITYPEITNGLMFRKEMGENEGMLFVFREPHRASFWMKNTLLPLTCAYIDRKGVILEVRNMKPLDETPIEAVTAEVQYVLEMNHGWFERKGVKPGMVARTERGSLAETYAGKAQY